MTSQSKDLQGNQTERNGALVATGGLSNLSELVYRGVLTTPTNESYYTYKANNRIIKRPRNQDLVAVSLAHVCTQSIKGGLEKPVETK